MPIEFFIHNEIDDTNELRAIYRFATLMQDAYGDSDRYFAAVFNLDPTIVPMWEELQLNQLDCLLLSEKFWAIIDFKRYESPFIVKNIDGEWRVVDEHGRFNGERVRGGRALNPFRQAKTAQYRWLNFLEDQVGWLFRDKYDSIPWSHLNDWILFFPKIHPDSTDVAKLIPVRQKKWLRIGGVDDVVQFSFEARSLLNVARADLGPIIEHILHAKRWQMLYQHFSEPIGQLLVQNEVGNLQSVDRIMLYPYQTLTFGRSRENDVVISRAFRRVSGKHLRVETREDAVRVYDIGSSRGTYCVNQKVGSGVGLLLRAGDEVVLGGIDDAEACRLRFIAYDDGGGTVETYRTTLTG